MSKSNFRYVVFTDASFKHYAGRGYCGFGVVVVNMESNCYASFGGDLSDHTIVFGESWAILKGVQKALDLIKRSPKQKGNILIVTDSKLCVNILTRFIHLWDTSDWQDWKTLRGKSVKNQEIYKRIVRLMQEHPDVHFRITHMHGHIGKKYEDTIRKDLHRYGIKPTDETVSTFRKMNAKVDAIAQESVDRQIRLESKYGILPIMKRSNDNGTEHDEEELCTAGGTD
ncbi:MAG: hypothetical protein NC489_09090 [Ruminococcus flavefaciens]|nr:hypothetical protein [Ruminococcus flavefaciens]